MFRGGRFFPDTVYIEICAFEVKLTAGLATDSDHALAYRRRQQTLSVRFNQTET